VTAAHTGLSLHNSENVTVTGNRFDGGGLELDGVDRWDYQHAIDDTNPACSPIGSKT